MNIKRSLNGKETLFRGDLVGEYKLINVYPALDESDYIIGQLVHILPNEELNLGEKEQ